MVFLYCCSTTSLYLFSSIFSILLVTSFPIQSVCLLSLAFFLFHAVLSAKGQQKLFSIFFVPCVTFLFLSIVNAPVGKGQRFISFRLEDCLLPLKNWGWREWGTIFTPQFPNFCRPWCSQLSRTVALLLRLGSTFPITPTGFNQHFIQPREALPFNFFSWFFHFFSLVFRVFFLPSSVVSPSVCLPTFNGLIRGYISKCSLCPLPYVISDWIGNCAVPPLGEELRKKEKEWEQVLIYPFNSSSSHTRRKGIKWWTE